MIWAFGDSNTEDYNPEHDWANRYINWKSYKPKIYLDYISEYFDTTICNFGKGGTNNYHIFQKFCDVANQFQENDIIILQWSEFTRFRLVDDENEWVDFYFTNSHNKAKLKAFKHIDIRTIQEVLLNRTYKKYEEEIRSWEKVIKILLKNRKFIIWSPFDESHGHGKWVKSMETISMETNRFIDDPHLSESGQKRLAKILIDKLEENKKGII